MEELTFPCQLFSSSIPKLFYISFQANIIAVPSQTLCLLAQRHDRAIGSKLDPA